MALSGMASMLKSFGIDPEKIMADYDAFRKGVGELLTGINARLTKIEELQGTLVSQQAQIQEQNSVILKLVQEVTQWKRLNNPAVVLHPQNQPQQPPVVQQQPNQ